VKDKKNYYKNLPETPGVYLMKDAKGKLLYVGKAGNLRRRVSSYFLRLSASAHDLRTGRHDARIEGLVQRIGKIDHENTDSALEALILESALIKKHQPPFNIREKDDKSFLYVGVTKEEFPRVLLIRGKDFKKEGSDMYLRAIPVPSRTEHSSERSARKREERNVRLRAGFGPFVSASSVREALRIIRRIFPWNVHEPEKVGVMKRPCFDYGIGLCPGMCIGGISKSEYMKTVRNIVLFFSGEKKKIIMELEYEMKKASKKLEFEKAEKIKRQLFALQHIHDTALINENEIGNWKLEIGNSAKRVEGYDISNISGTDPVGSMVVFMDDKPMNGEYKKFIIKTVKGSNDVGMLREVLKRRFSHTPKEKGWAYPDLVLVDGGKGQANTAKRVLAEKHINIPVLGIAKGPERKRNDIIGVKPEWVSERTLEQVRNEAHRFAITFHKKRRSATFISSVGK